MRIRVLLTVLAIAVGVLLTHSSAAHGQTSKVLRGDINLDGQVDFLDISPFINLLSGGTFQAEGDVDGDLEVNFLDIAPFISILSGNGPTVQTIDDLVAGDLVINEFTQNPSAVGDSSGEWFEIKVSDSLSSPVDLIGLEILDDGSDAHTVDDNLVVSAGQYIVFGINADENFNGGVAVDYEYSNFTLGNGDDEIVLVVPSSGLTIDRINYDNGSTFPDGNGSSASLSVIHEGDAVANDTGGNWFLESIQTYGDGDSGTPGARNSADLDGDGFFAGADGGADCNDDDASINPAATDIAGDGVDQNCDGFDN